MAHRGTRARRSCPNLRGMGEIELKLFKNDNHRLEKSKKEA